MQKNDNISQRFELGEMFERDPVHLIVGVEDGVHGKKYIKHKFLEKFKYNILDTFDELLHEIILKT